MRSQYVQSERKIPPSGFLDDFCYLSAAAPSRQRSTGGVGSLPCMRASAKCYTCKDKYMMASVAAVAVVAVVVLVEVAWTPQCSATALARRCGRRNGVRVSRKETIGTNGESGNKPRILKKRRGLDGSRQWKGNNHPVGFIHRATMALMRLPPADASNFLVVVRGAGGAA